MITLITGTPGAGKTLYAVHSILKPEGEGARPVYVDGIPDLLTRHEPSPDVNEWHTWAPDGALICVDEAQRVWRPAAPGSRVPESIAQLETHRHRGLDFVIITQHPNLIHANVRKLVGRHIHLRRTALGVYLYEWPEATNPETRKGQPSYARLCLCVRGGDPCSTPGGRICDFLNRIKDGGRIAPGSHPSPGFSTSPWPGHCAASSGS